MMRALKFLVLCTFTCVWTIDIFIDGPVDLFDCRGHDGTKMFESTTTTPTAEATEELNALSEGRIISFGNEEFFVVTTQELRWDEARSWCQQHWGGDLASLSDPRAFGDQLFDEEGLPYGRFWVGGQKSGGSWSWVNGGGAITTGWFPGEPDGGDCVYLYPHAPFGPLADCPCSWSSYFICER